MQLPLFREKQWQKITLTLQFFRIRNIARTQWYKINSNWAASTIQREAMTKNNTDLDIFQCECPMNMCSLLLNTVSHFWYIGNSSAPQFCANLSGMMTNCAKLHYSFTSTAWIWCKNHAQLCQRKKTWCRNLVQNRARLCQWKKTRCRKHGCPGHHLMTK